jgi:hypothetical protein
MPSFTSAPVLLPLLLQAIPGSWSAPTGAPLFSRQSSEPEEYTANPSIGPGGSTFLDSPHFRVYGNSGDEAQNALGKLEAAFECFVRGLNFRSTGLSFNSDNDAGPWTKTNIYAVSELANAAGVMHSDATTGMGYVEVQQDYLTAADVSSRPQCIDSCCIRHNVQLILSDLFFRLRSTNGVTPSTTTRKRGSTNLAPVHGGRCSPTGLRTLTKRQTTVLRRE